MGISFCDMLLGFRIDSHERKVDPNMLLDGEKKNPQMDNQYQKTYTDIIYN